MILLVEKSMIKSSLSNSLSRLRLISKSTSPLEIFSNLRFVCGCGDRSYSVPHGLTGFLIGSRDSCLLSFVLQINFGFILQVFSGLGWFRMDFCKAIVDFRSFNVPFNTAVSIIKYAVE